MMYWTFTCHSGLSKPAHRIPLATVLLEASLKPLDNGVNTEEWGRVVGEILKTSFNFLYLGTPEVGYIPCLFT